MSIQKISKEQLRRMGNQEGLILQGCGGDPQEWLDGINQILTDEGILKKGIRFEEAYTFQHDGVTCLLFPFKEGMIDAELSSEVGAAQALYIMALYGTLTISYVISKCNNAGPEFVDVLSFRLHRTSQIHVEAKGIFLDGVDQTAHAPCGIYTHCNVHVVIQTVVAPYFLFSSCIVWFIRFHTVITPDVR